jgi:hypothetical protein
MCESETGAIAKMRSFCWPNWSRFAPQSSSATATRRRFTSEALPFTPEPQPPMKSISRIPAGVAPPRTCGPFTEKLNREWRTSKESEFLSFWSVAGVEA